MENKTNPEVISYQLLRRAVGIIGISLPIVLATVSFIACDCCSIQVSMSNYYHTCMRNIFVGVMCAISFFMFAYKGYEKEDRIAGLLAFIFALGVAWLPTNFKGEACCNQLPYIEYTWVGYVHYTSAALLFGVFIYFSLVLFTRTYSSGQMTARKRKRNTIYRICGYVMIGCVVFCGFYSFLLKGRWPGLDKLNIVFWCETLALWAFGTSWLTKGKVIYGKGE